MRPSPLVLKNPPANARDIRDLGSILLGSGRPPVEGMTPTPIFFPEKSHGRGAWHTIVHSVAKNQDMTEMI